MTISYGISEKIGWRESMEDEYVVYRDAEKDFLSAEVYDGHGGRRAAQLAAEMLTPFFLHAWSRELEKNLQERRQEPDLVREAFIAVDDHLVGQGLDCGTTAATFYIMGDRFLAANTGDTRVVIGTGDGARILTKDHKPGVEEERSRIESLGGRVILHGVPRVQGILAISRALGDTFLKPYVSPEPRIVEGRFGSENDYAVLACDGVWDVLDEREVMGLTREAGDPQAAADLIAATALEKGSADNITVIVLDLRKHTKDLKDHALKILSITDRAGT